MVPRNASGSSESRRREALTEYVKVVLFGLTEVGLAALSVAGGEYVAFGNDQNDIKLFQGARYAVCVGDSDAGAYADLVVARDDVGATIDALISASA